MAEREDLELQRSTAPKGGEKCGQKSGQEVSEGESKEKGQLPVYQSDRILRERQSFLLGLADRASKSLMFPDEYTIRSRLYSA